MTHAHPAARTAGKRVPRFSCLRFYLWSRPRHCSSVTLYGVFHINQIAQTLTTNLSVFYVEAGSLLIDFSLTESLLSFVQMISAALLIYNPVFGGIDILAQSLRCL
ncbi:hypothetical protein VTN00DRAFT_5939 [Thermoascus crustaceus]|uniref:uncharacterized protein n=1 Tax=Thermoascus crustaceus TaxID=5088 RepID=UPI003743E13A